MSTRRRSDRGSMLTYATEYCAIFVLLLVTAYIVPAGLFHYLCFRRRSPATEASRIQKRRPRPQDIRREIRQSVSALLLFSVYCLIVYHAAGTVRRHSISSSGSTRGGGRRRGSPPRWF